MPCRAARGARASRIRRRCREPHRCRNSSAPRRGTLAGVLLNRTSCRAPSDWPGSPRAIPLGRLALRELRGLACLVQAGLLALDLARIARQEAFPFEGNPQLRIRLDEGPGDAVANRAGLA